MSQQVYQQFPKNPIAQVYRGITYPIAAIKYIKDNSLWRDIAIPIGVNILFFSLLLGFSIYGFNTYGSTVENFIVGPPQSSLHGLRVFLSYLVWFFVAVIALGLNGVVLLVLGQAVASPFLDSLSERVECAELGTEVQKMSFANVARSISVAVTDLFWSLLLLAVVHIGILFIGWIPVVGTLPAAAISFSFNALILSQEFGTLALSRRFVGYRARLGQMTRNFWVTLGFGSACVALLLVPFLNLILLPVATVGGALMYSELKQAQKITL